MCMGLSHFFGECVSFSGAVGENYIVIKLTFSDSKITNV